MGEKKQKKSFEDTWKMRFRRYADRYEDDAAIAGWSPNGLRTRFRNFARIWKQCGRCTAGDELWLDAGCGAGTYTRYLQDCGCSVIGLDYSAGSLVKARRRSPDDIRWIVGDVRNLPFIPGSFKGVICFGVTQAVSDSRDLVRELTSCVAQNGEVWVDVLNVWFLPNLIVHLKKALLKQEPHVRYESPMRMRRLLQDHGMYDTKIHWIPILTERLAFLVPIVESRFFMWIMNHVPGVGHVLCHSALLQARR